MTDRRVAVRIAYLGNDFSGSQYQPGLRTVLGDVASDLAETGGGRSEEWFDLKCASRTDAGVNALGNVIVFNTFFNDDAKLLKALNAVSGRIYYTAIATVDADFNPRFADERVYRYMLPAKGIDVGLARECAELFTGEHDFVRFCKANGKPTVLDMRSIEVSEEGGMLILVFRARYFLWNMIRKITAAISSVGAGDTPIERIGRALEGDDMVVKIVRPDALTLMEVRYDGIDFSVPAGDLFTKRTDEEKFVLSLKNDFFSSL